MQTEATQQRDPESIILEALAAAPVPPTDLKERLKRQIPKLNDKQFKAVLSSLVAARRIHGKPKLSAKGQPTKTMESYALGAPPAPPAPQDEILRALGGGPLSPARLKERTKAALRGLVAKDYVAALAELVSAQQIHGRYKLRKDGSQSKTIDDYALGAPPPPPPPLAPPHERAPREILSLLEVGPLSLAEIKQRTKLVLKGLSAKDYTAVLADLVASRKIYARYRRGNNGAATKTVESYGKGAPPADDFVAPVLALYETMRAEAKRLGVTEASFTASLLEGLSKSGIQIQSPRRTEPSSDDRVQVLRGVRELVAREGSGALIPIRKLRSTVELDKGLLDAALLQLFADDAIILHHHDYVGSLTEAERGELLLDRHGNYYIGVALKGEG